MTSDPDTTPTLDPRLSKIVGGFIMITLTLGTIALRLIHKENQK